MQLDTFFCLETIHSQLHLNFFYWVFIFYTEGKKCKAYYSFWLTCSLKKTSVKVQFFFFVHSHVEKGVIRGREVYASFSFTMGHYSRGLIYLIIFLSRPTAVFAVECQSWLNVACLLWKVHAWSTQVSLFNPSDYVTSFQPSQAMSLVCMWIFVFVPNASLACVLVRILSNAHPVHEWVVTRKEASLMAQAACQGCWPLNNFTMWV